MGFMDAFTPEITIELKVSVLSEIIKEAAEHRAVANHLLNGVKNEVPHKYIREVIPIYDDVWLFSEGLAAVKKQGKWGFIDKAGKQIIPFRYEAANTFSQGVVRVKLSGKFFYINKKDECVKDCSE